MTDDLSISLRALADPTRRAIVDMLNDQGPQRAGDIAAQFPDLARTGISKHLRVLRESALIVEVDADDARERRYDLSPENLRVVNAWLSRYERFWGDNLDRLRDLAEDDPGVDEA